METKLYRAARFKRLNEDGTGTAVVATLNVIDKDGDITLPGAFGEQTIKVQPAHDWSAPAIGTATIYETATEARADFKFNLNMTSGREWYESMKFAMANNTPTEWSYGFNVLEEDWRTVDGRQVRGLLKLKVHEISPVLVGAGVNTRTLSLKQRGAVKTPLKTTPGATYHIERNDQGLLTRLVERDTSSGLITRVMKVVEEDGIDEIITQVETVHANVKQIIKNRESFEPNRKRLKQLQRVILSQIDDVRALLGEAPKAVLTPEHEFEKFAEFQRKQRRYGTN
jgi:hypothetical protein